MKNYIPRYTQGDSKLVVSKFSPKDKKILDKFMLYCGGTAGKSKLEVIHRCMVKFIDVIETPLDKIDLNTLREFLAVLKKSDLAPATKNEVKKHIKRFLKEQYPSWNTRFKGLKDIKGENDINQDKINGNTILTKNEFQRLVRSAESLKWKAMLMLFWESAGRPEEIYGLKWKDIDLEKGDVKLKSSKTGNVRINPLKDSVLHLKRYKQEYPYDNVQADDWVFPHHKNREEKITKGMVLYHVKTLGKRTLNKLVFPYLIRHTRATELQKLLTAKIYEKFMDHSIKTATRYSHLNKSDVRDALMSKVYEIEEITQEQKENYDKKITELQKKLEKHEKLFQKIMNRNMNDEILDLTEEVTNL